jgi:PIN domain nuclease of toxin-antitoxin system
MRLLLDTHVLLWAITNDSRLQGEARATVEDGGNDVIFSVASIWEIAIKAALGRADFVRQPTAIAQAARDTGFVELPIHSSAAALVAGLLLHHRDPFDRLLVAQAMTEPAILYTADHQLGAYSELVVCV